MYVCVQARATCKRASASEQTYILIDTKTEKLMNRDTESDNHVFSLKGAHRK